MKYFLLPLLAVHISLISSAQEPNRMTVSKPAIKQNVSLYDSIRNYHEGFAAVCRDHKWGYINRAGVEVIAPAFTCASDFIEHSAVVFAGKWVEIDTTGTVTAPATQRKAERFMAASFSSASLAGPAAPQTVNHQTNRPIQDASLGSCPANIDFENGDFTNWYCFTGLVSTNGAGNNVVTYFNSAPPQNSPVAGRHTLITATTPSALDPYGGFPINPPDGSGHAVKLGNDIVHDSAEKVRYIIQVPANATNYSITFQYACVLENPTNSSVHTPSEKPRMLAQVIDPVTNAVVQCADFLYVAAGSIPGFYNSAVDPNVKCKSWTPVFVNLSGYAGRTLYLEFITADCTLGAHFGYGYVDVGPCSQPVTTLSRCIPTNQSTLTAPAGFQAYNWWDANYTTILGTGQIFTVTPSPPAGTVYHVELIPAAGSTCKDTLTAQVNPSVPTVNAGPDHGICPGGTISIGATATPGYTYQWSPAGTLSNSTISNPISSATQNTSYIVTVTDANGCTAKDTTVVNMNPVPVAAFSATDADQCLVQNSFVFQNNTAISAGSFNSSWNFGDGNSSTTLSPTHSYAAPGTYTVTLTTTSNLSCVNTVSHIVHVYPEPTVSFAPNTGTQCLLNNNFVFANSSSVSGGTLTYQWTFGDGATSTSTSPSHSYTQPGAYAVHLVVTTNNGCKDSLTQSVVVAPMPNMLIAVNNISQCFHANSVSFTNSSTIATGTMSWQWNFGDGATSTQFSPAHSYAAPGTYNVVVTATSDKGCVDTRNYTVTINPQPVVSFAPNTGTQCLLNNNFVFANSSSVSGGTLTYQWTFGDGGTSTSASPSHTYTQPGTYAVHLVVTTNNGCKDSLTQSVIVAPMPNMLIAANNIVQCFHANSVSFTNSSTIATGTMSWQWNFGDGATSTQYSPTHSYATPGTYNVVVTATSDKGCVDTRNFAVVINPQPVVSFAPNTGTQCLLNNNFVFANSSSVSGGTLTYQWTFGDGGTSTSAAPSHTYTQPGTYAVHLVVTTNNGCKDSLTQSVVVAPMPNMSIAVNNIVQCFHANSVAFTNSSTIATGTMNWAWNFGDGATSAQYSPTHSYATPGTYNVVVTATSDKGCVDTRNFSVVINPQPVVSFSPNTGTQCLLNNNFVFANSSSVTSGTISYQWTFGDGATSTSAVPSHSYTQPGTYAVHLVVTTNNGCKDSLTQSVVVAPMPNVQVAGNNNMQCVNGNNFTFSNNSTILTGSMTWHWDFGDGITSTQFNPVHNYTTPGNYIVTITATSDKGCMDTKTINITVYSKPVISFAPNNAAQCFRNNNFIFTNNSNISSGTLTYQWNFGDGQTSTQAAPSHSYAQPGTYPVKLLVISNNGCRDSLTQSVIVAPMPTALFGVTNSAQCLNGNSFSFSNNSTLSSGNPGWHWDFGDGTISTAQSPSHIYATAGSYSVQLIATSPSGCADTISHPVNVYAKPTVAFTAQPVTLCLFGNNTHFNNTSSINPGSLTYKWWFGDGDTSTLASPAHVYTAADSYNVKLLTVSDHGCRDSVTHPVVIHANPQLALTTTNGGTAICRGNTTTLTASGASLYQWTPATGLSCSNCASPIAAPLTTTTYIATGFSSFSCPGVDSVRIIVHQPINIAANGGDICFGGTKGLHASGAASYAWTPAAGLNDPGAPNPAATPAATTHYRVVGFDGVNCFTDTAYVLVNVWPNPTLTLGPDLELATGAQQVLTAVTSNAPIATWLWSPADFLSCTRCPNPVATVHYDITYKLTATTAHGCSITDDIRIKTFCKDSQVFFPDAFTPDGDGLNDIFMIRGKGIISVNYLRIFNRWGELIFERTNFSPNNPAYGWDGKIRGVKGPPDVFVYTAEVVCDNGVKNIFKGNVSVLR